MSYSRRKVMKALGALGFLDVREGGRHTIVRSEDGNVIGIPRHRELRRGSVRGIAEDAGVDWNDFQADIS